MDLAIRMPGWFLSTTAAQAAVVVFDDVALTPTHHWQGKPSTPISAENIVTAASLFAAAFLRCSSR